MTDSTHVDYLDPCERWKRASEPLQELKTQDESVHGQEVVGLSNGMEESRLCRRSEEDVG